MGPLSWSAIAAGSAALAESLGLGAAATGLIVGNRNKNIEEFKEWAKTQYPMPEIKVNVPSTENALVLRPEYRIETPVLPGNYVNPLKVITEVTDAAGARHFVDTANLYNHPDQVPDPKKPKKDNEDKKPFWKSTPGKALKWGIGIGIGGATAPWAVGGIYKYFHDYVPYAIGETIKDTPNAELKDSDIREIE